MGKTTITIPLVTLRPTPEGTYRPRYIPGARHRKLGFKGEDLRHADGTWFSLDECAAWSKGRQLLVDQTAALPPKKRRAQRHATGLITVGELFERWFADPRLNGKAVVNGKKHRDPLKANTVRYYRNAAAQLEKLDGGKVWLSPASAITSAMLANPDRGILHRIEVVHGLSTARSVRAAISSCWGWGIGKGLVAGNPASGAGDTLPLPAPRIRVGSIEEIRALVAAADMLTRTGPEGGTVTHADIGDAIMLGAWTGQRQNDRLRLEDGRITDAGIIFRQGKKHGQPLLIPMAPDLAARLNAARIRRGSWRVNYPHVVLDDAARRPFADDWYRKLFTRVRRAAAHGILADGTVPKAPIAPEAVARHQWRIMPTPSLADFHDQDLRDTAVTWLALAGCSKLEIAAITGHSPKSVDDILKHYLGLHPDLARSAIGKLVTWFDQQKGEGNA